MADMPLERLTLKERVWLVAAHIRMVEDMIQGWISDQLLKDERNLDDIAEAAHTMRASAYHQVLSNWAVGRTPRERDKDALRLSKELTGS